MKFKYGWMSFALVVIILLLSAPSRAATPSCQNIPDYRYPGLQRCKVSVDLETQQANPPEPQKMSLWCWAASLSMIFTAAGHPISQESIVIQNYGKLVNAPGGDFLLFQSRLNRVYIDDNGVQFKSVARQMQTPADAKDALENDLPILYTTGTHATVQLSLIYEVAPGGPVVFRGGEIWDPATGTTRQLNQKDVATYKAAWSIDVTTP